LVVIAFDLLQDHGQTRRRIAEEAQAEPRADAEVALGAQEIQERLLGSFRLDRRQHARGVVAEVPVLRREHGVDETRGARVPDPGERSRRALQHVVRVDSELVDERGNRFADPSSSGQLDHEDLEPARTIRRQHLGPGDARLA
jgi:hypothetical protein